MKRNIYIFLFLLLLISSCKHKVEEIQQTQNVHQRQSFNEFFMNIKNSIVEDTLMRNDFNFGQMPFRRSRINYGARNFTASIDRDEQYATSDNIRIRLHGFSLDTHRVIKEFNVLLDLTRKLRVSRIFNNKDFGELIFEFDTKGLQLNTLPEYQFYPNFEFHEMGAGEGRLIYEYDANKTSRVQRIDSCCYSKFEDKWYIMYIPENYTEDF